MERAEVLGARYGLIPEVVRSMTPAEFRRFVKGAQQRVKDEWRRTAHIMAMIDRATPRKSGRSKSPQQLVPWAFAPEPEDD